MLPILATVALIIAAVAATTSLMESWLVFRAAVRDLACERTAARLGFVPQVEAQELRIRRVMRQDQNPLGRGPARVRGLPLRFALPACGAA
jgi:hypothetical protein